ncbi:MAG: aspartate aminotransferase family protein [Bacteroidetes bacterium]|nr:MAG: aspartate aminotransferase family protein [Bacteroidota bacterium]PTM13935.1 MAG: aspartate aminotransferase family protein [Bacteroidota bacterium]
MENNNTPAWLREAEEVLIRYCKEFSPVLIDRAAGSYIYTQDGKAILDFTSGQMCAIIGHNHPRVQAALASSHDKAWHLLSTLLSEPVIRLCQELVALLPEGLDKAILVNTGSESNEVALRMAKLYTNGHEVLGFIGSWHGMTAGAQGSTYSHTRQGYGPVGPGNLALPAPYAYRCPVRHCQGTCDHTCLEVGMDLADRQSVGAPAAVMIEPILSAAGIVDLPPGYLAKLKAMSAERGYLMILDEAQTGMGRLGDWFGFEQEGVTPDFLTLSKTLGGGLPLAATLTSREIEQVCFERGFLYITSHVSDPLPAIAGLAVLDIIREQKLVVQAAEKGNYLKAGLQKLQEVHACMGDVRGRGLLLGVEIVKDRHTREPAPELGWAISKRCLELGLNMNIVRLPGMSGVFRIAPPLTVSYEELDLGLSILDQAIREQQ